MFRKENWSLLAKNQERSVFYQVDLQEAAEAFAKGGIALPEEEHVSPAAKRFITYALDRLPELDVL